MTRTIYADTLPEVTKRLDRIAKKAARYGVPFSYTVGDEHPQEVAIYAVDYVEHVQYVERTFTVSGIDIEIECDALVRADGWRVLAHIEHGDSGNIVTAIGGAAIDPAWYTAPARCDHCGTNRTRATTFIVEHDNGDRRQVGKSCLKDYTGIAPSVALLWAEVSDIFPNMSMTESEWNERKPARMYDVRKILAHAADVIKAHGYRKSDSHDSTRGAVADLVKAEAEPTPDGLATADEIVAWLIERGRRADADNAELKALWRDVFGDGEDDGNPRYWNRAREIANAWDAVSDLEANCVPLARSGYAKIKHIGRLVYMPIAYKKFAERKAAHEAREAARIEAATRSSHVGNVGDRIEFTAASAEFVTSWETAYGHTFLYKFTDGDGNVFVWFASGAFDERAGMKVRGTVKKHDERDGVKQTVLTRCRVS